MSVPFSLSFSFEILKVHSVWSLNRLRVLGSASRLWSRFWNRLFPAVAVMFRFIIIIIIIIYIHIYIYIYRHI